MSGRKKEEADLWICKPISPSWLPTISSGVGNFVVIDLIAATTNALNGALLAQRPDYYRGKQWTLVGIIILAIFGGIGGGSARDIIAGKLPPSSWMNPWYLILCVLAGIVGMLTAYGKGQNFRETWFQFMTAFSLPWYAAMGVHVGLQVGMPPLRRSPSAWSAPPPAAS